MGCHQSLHLPAEPETVGNPNILPKHGTGMDLDISDDDLKKIVAAAFSDSDEDVTEDPNDMVSVQVVVPRFLQPTIRPDKVLPDFVPPLCRECSWTKPRADETPSSVALAPDRVTHEQYVKHLDKFLKKVSRSPDDLERNVSCKRLDSGMPPLPTSQESRHRPCMAPRFPRIF
mmetsp:Transcript_7667/g.17647  ORF Transcript_7667/g.17647 Transcript_7667/m.17647 type:complete len:173 (-) Transcript_7667:348-866(-)